MAELLGDLRLLSKKYFEEIYVPQNQRENWGTVVSREALQNKVVCLFFSASWCAPCQHFVPTLKEIYTELKRRGDPLEIIFINFDKTYEEMMEYYKTKHGDWFAVQFGDPIKEVLTEKYKINVIPKLVVVQPNGDVITSKGRKDIQDKGLVCMRAWKAALVHSSEKQTEEQLTEDVS